MSTITGQTRLAALFASPARHSISPVMHSTAFDELGINAVYLAFEITPAQLPAAIQSIRELDMIGVNLSMPHKMAAMKLVDEVSEAGQLIGAINTIVNHEGHLVGHNTDGVGAMSALKEKKIEIVNKEITVIGAGGAATAIISQAALDGVKKIHVFNRHDQFFDVITEKLKNIAAHTHCTITLHDLADEQLLATCTASSSLLVNATGVGMAPNADATPFKDLSILRRDLPVFDVIYNPRETQLVKAAKAVGATTLNGLGMLLYQGVEAFRLWTGQEMPVAIIKPIVENS
jgi:shikimate dehydrogenase